jgi:hypothetical protein
MDFQLIDTISHENLPLHDMQIDGNLLRTSWGSFVQQKKTVYQKGRLRDLSSVLEKPNQTTHLISDTGLERVSPNTKAYNDALPKTVIKDRKIYKKVGNSGLKLMSSILLEEGYYGSIISLEDNVLVASSAKRIGRKFWKYI